MNETKLTEEKLQAKLDEWFGTVADYGEVEDDQAYQQIKRMIENYEEVQAFALEIIEGKQEKSQSEYSTGYDCLLNEVKSAIQKQRGSLDEQSKQLRALLIPQKPTVMIAEVKAVLEDLIKAHETYKKKDSAVRHDLLAFVHWLRGKGMEVVEK